MKNFAQIYVKLDIFGIFLFKKGLNPISLVAALLPLLLFPSYSSLPPSSLAPNPPEPAPASGPVPPPVTLPVPL